MTIFFPPDWHWWDRSAYAERFRPAFRLSIINRDTEIHILR